MRRSSYLILAALLWLIGPSCSKSTNTVVPPLASISVPLLMGTYELYAVTGGIGGGTTYPAGNGNLLIFLPNGHFLAKVPGYGSGGGQFSLEPVPGKTFQLLVRTWYKSSVVQRDSVAVSGDELDFLPPVACCDWQTTVYKRK